MYLDQLRAASEAAEREQLETENGDLRAELTQIKGQLTNAVGTVQNQLASLTQLWLGSAAGLPQLVLEASSVAAEALSDKERERSELELIVTRLTTEGSRLETRLKRCEWRLECTASDLEGVQSELVIVQAERSSMQVVLVSQIIAFAFAQLRERQSERDAE